MISTTRSCLWNLARKGHDRVGYKINFVIKPTYSFDISVRVIIEYKRSNFQGNTSGNEMKNKIMVLVPQDLMLIGLLNYFK